MRCLFCDCPLPLTTTAAAHLKCHRSEEWFPRLQAMRANGLTDEQMIATVRLMKAAGIEP